MSNMVATGQEMVREKNSSRSGESPGISLQVRENFSLWKKSRNSEVLSQSTFCTFYGHESCYIVHEIEEQADVGFSRKFDPFWTLCYETINSCTLHVSCWKHKLILKWLQGIRPWEMLWVLYQDWFVPLLIQWVKEILHLGKRQGKSGISETSGCSNPVKFPLWSTLLLCMVFS